MTIRRTILILTTALALLGTACSNATPDSLASTEDSGTDTPSATSTVVEAVSNEPDPVASGGDSPTSVDSSTTSTEAPTPTSTRLGKAIADIDNVELRTDTLDELAALLADAYGFDDDVVITQVGEVEVADAVGGDATYDLTGLKDDSVDGFRVDIGFHFDKNADATEITGFIATQITKRALCSRGVTDDGLCI